jgi:DNA-binding FrmR family transcriptional regulator
MAATATTARKKKAPAMAETGHACLHLDADARKDARLRLLSVRGHVEGILRMLEDDSVYCVDVLKQIKAVDGALDKVGNLILKAHLHDHVVTAAKRGDEEAIVAELMEVLKYR